MTITITIHCDNAAFEDDPGMELAHILRRTGFKLELGVQDLRIMDSNGNHVGELRVTP